MQSNPGRVADYPKHVDLSGEEISLRLLGVDDAAKLHDFFLELPPTDLLFLQRDVTDYKEIDAWMAEVAGGETVTLIAEADGSMLGEATIRGNHVPWTRHVGTVRVVTAAVQRSRGLGRLLLGEIFQIAAARGVEKIVAEMTVEQAGAIRLFQQLGFREEGRYRAYVKDRSGIAHDLVVMTHDPPALFELDAPEFAGLQGWRCDACGHVTPATEAPQRCPDCGAAGELLSPATEIRSSDT
jgi:L-amino acid N-acyltransferase YncA